MRLPLTYDLTETKDVESRDIRKSLLIAVGSLWFIIQMYWAGFGFPGVMMVRPLHLIFALIIIYLAHPIIRRKRLLSIILNTSPLILLIIAAIHYVINYDRIMTRWAMFSPLTLMDLVVVISILILSLEAGRRVIGPGLSILAIAFLIYGVFGKYLPGILAHQGLSVLHMLDLQGLTDFGLYGIALGVSVVFVYYFVIFGVVLQQLGGDKLFTDVAFATTGRSWGGPAKAAVVGSSAIGMISGSAAANVVTSGVITIPLMKKSGFPSHVAAAIEAAASTGSQIMPPIMGAQAFLMAYLLQLPYWEIVKASFIPAVLYYAYLYIIVHIYSLKYGVRPIEKHELPDFRKTIKNYGHLLIPFVILVYLVAKRVTLTKAAFYSLLLLFGMSFLRKSTRLNLKKFIVAIEEGSKSSAMVAIECALAGVIIGVVDYTGLGVKMSNLIIQFSGGNLLIALVLTMGVVIILGLGMPTVGAYLSAAILIGPALIRLGLDPLVAHMFISYFAVVSMVTPPVAISAYVAAGIADANITKTGITAFIMSIFGFIVPFLIVVNPSLIYLKPLNSLLLVLFVLFVSLVTIYVLSTKYMLKKYVNKINL